MWIFYQNCTLKPFIYNKYKKISIINLFLSIKRCLKPARHTRFQLSSNQLNRTRQKTGPTKTRCRVSRRMTGTFPRLIGIKLPVSMAASWWWTRPWGLILAGTRQSLVTRRQPREGVGAGRGIVVGIWLRCISRYTRRGMRHWRLRNDWRKSGHQSSRWSLKTTN